MYKIFFKEMDEAHWKKKTNNKQQETYKNIQPESKDIKKNPQEMQA